MGTGGYDSGAGGGEGVVGNSADAGMEGRAGWGEGRMACGMLADGDDGGMGDK